MSQDQSLGPFKVQPQQKRQLSINHSFVTSVGNKQSYESYLKMFKQMKTDKIDIQTIHRSSKLKLKRYKQAIYYGQFVNNKREGLGIMIYQNGQKYYGQWKQDQRNGEGYQVFSNGCTYQGSYVQNKMSGQGRYTWINGQKYQGEWENNLKNGTGMWESGKGDSYVGEWVFGQATGFGVFIENEGSRYQGNFQAFKKSGKGTQKFKSGDVYIGHYQNGKFQGFGQYYWKDGSFYKGGFKNGLRHGEGIWKKVQGDKYQGNFKNNQKEGFGIYSWSSGNIYKGNYEKNVRQGYGEMYWNDNSFFKGQWMNDKPNGQGEMFDGKTLTKGVFINGLVSEVMEMPSETSIYSSSVKQSEKRQRNIATPIEKISKAQQTITKWQYKLNSYEKNDSSFEQTRSKKSTGKGHESFVRRKLTNTINLSNNQKPRQFKIGKDIEPKNKKDKSEERVLHSSFHIHRLHNKLLQKRKERQLNEQLVTLDNELQFAYGLNRHSRNRYYSRLQ